MCITGLLFTCLFVRSFVRSMREPIYKMEMYMEREVRIHLTQKMQTKTLSLHIMMIRGSLYYIPFLTQINSSANQNRISHV